MGGGRRGQSKDRGKGSGTGVAQGKGQGGGGGGRVKVLKKGPFCMGILVTLSLSKKKAPIGLKIFSSS